MPEIAYRLSGVVLILGAALLGIAIVIIAQQPLIDQLPSPGVSFLLLLSAILLLLSLPAMYAKQAHAAGRWLAWLFMAARRCVALRLRHHDRTSLPVGKLHTFPGFYPSREKR